VLCCAQTSPAHDNKKQKNKNKTRLVDAEPKKLYCPLPVLYVTGVLAKDRRRAGQYEAPVYRSKARMGRNFVTTFSLRTEEDKAKWTLCGVALLCSVD
jgi:dynein heavy chain